MPDESGSISLRVEFAERIESDNFMEKEKNQLKTFMSKKTTVNLEHVSTESFQNEISKIFKESLSKLSIIIGLKNRNSLLELKLFLVLIKIKFIININIFRGNLKNEERKTFKKNWW